jgi:hypothetical protein
MRSNKALQPTPLGVGAAYGGRAPCGAAELGRLAAMHHANTIVLWRHG